MHKPLNQREHKPLSKLSEEHSVFLDDDNAFNAGQTLFYYDKRKNICIKLTH